MFPKGFPNPMKTAPREISGGRFHLVALGRCSPNILLTGVQDEVPVIDQPSTFVPRSVNGAESRQC
jgi:hypothetical protein